MCYFSCAEKDWEDIKFGVEHGVDFYALSFVKDSQVVHELKAFLKGKHGKKITFSITKRDESVEGLE